MAWRRAKEPLHGDSSPEIRPVSIGPKADARPRVVSRIRVSSPDCRPPACRGGRDCWRNAGSSDDPVHSRR
jgi:hypothetical protein